MQIKKVLTRIFIDSTEIDNSISFYEKLFKKECEMRFKYPEKELELAMIESVLLIAGSPERLKPFAETKVTLLVDSIDEFLEFLKNNGSTILEEPKSVPTGKNMRVKHPDDLVVEYVEHENSLRKKA